MHVYSNSILSSAIYAMYVVVQEGLDFSWILSCCYDVFYRNLKNKREKLYQKNLKMK